MSIGLLSTAIDYNFPRNISKQWGKKCIPLICRITLDPSIRYTVWSIILGGSLNATAVYSCLQTQAQRYLCVKNTRSAQKYAIRRENPQ